MREPNNAIVHFYRAAVMHTDMWRRRTDATTNWAVVSTAALITFSFSDPTHPHFILLVGFAFDLFFLLMESRRYQVLQRWRTRVHELNRLIIAPNLCPATALPDEEIEAGLEVLAGELGNTTPKISLIEAMGYRTRRNYGFVFLVVLLTWLLKIWYHPTPGGDLLERAAIGVLPGDVVLLVMFLTSTALAYIALSAPSEAMEHWETIGSPMERIASVRTKIPDVPLPFRHHEERGRSQERGTATSPPVSPPPVSGDTTPSATAPEREAHSGRDEEDEPPKPPTPSGETV